jgi:predicted Zn finger-like uncharacterized protein
MSLKTRCPACDTVFKIVADQLKVSSGWVRCGRCAEVFDAASHAVASDAATAWPQVTTTPAAAADQAIRTELTQKITPKNIAESDLNTPATVASPLNIDIYREVQIAETDLSFVRIANSKAFWQRTAVVRSLRAASVGLIGLLFFQVVLSQRNHLVATHPAYKNGFDTLCKSIGCTVEPFKNIDALKIESSSFQKSQQVFTDNSQGENFALKLAIKNSTELAVAMPAVELTLTDSNDKPVLRRVLLPKDLGFSADTLAASGDWTGSMAVIVTPSSTKAVVTGYRVLLFYP